jgi:ribonucleotide monophosphatase NagD (HAD superfamily)
MSLLNRKPISIGRAARALRDDRVFLVATEDTYAPSQYFENLPLPRVKVFVLPTSVNSGHSSPAHVIERLKNAFQNVRQRKQIQSGDEFWVFFDTDHHFHEQHRAGTLQAMQTAQQTGFEIAVSNPCFELWLLLHHADVDQGTVFSHCSEVEQKLRDTLSLYNKTSIKASDFPLALVPLAIRRARALEATPDNPAGHWPQQTGTRIYRLLERILASTP